MKHDTEQHDMRNAGHIVLAALLFGVIFWYFAAVGFMHTYQILTTSTECPFVEPS